MAAHNETEASAGADDTVAGSHGGDGVAAVVSPGPWVIAATVQVLDSESRVAGAGFLAGENLVVTCAHVVDKAGSGRGGRVGLRFPHLPGAPVFQGRVLADVGRGQDAEDVAALRLEHVPPGARPAALGAAAGCRGHRVFSYGFPAQAPPQGHFGYGTAGDLLPGEQVGPQLQLTGANDLTTGFSGAPVVDEVTGLVIGMVTAITPQDRYDRGHGIAYATPAEVLRRLVPELTELQVSPYRGLEAFTTNDAAWFHGRREVVDNVLDGLRRHPLVMLLGPSGAGKSSLIQAGVLPALAEGAVPGSDRWLPVLVRPGRNLAAELERAGLPQDATADGTGGIAPAIHHLLEAQPGFDRLVLIIDQFEELLAHTHTGQDRHTPGPAVLENLIAAIDAHLPISVVLIMRNDFYPRLADVSPQLLEAAKPGSVDIPAQLTPSELQAIITRPAQDAGARFEDGLADRIIEDLRLADADRRTPATLLPPLQLALSQLWQRRTHGRLTHQAYRTIGAVSGSLAAWCDDAIGQLPAVHRPMAQRILTALVHPADEALAIPATRQQVPLPQLRALAANTPLARTDTDFDNVLAFLSQARIITTTSPTGDRTKDPAVELVHDALIRDWGSLRSWAARDRRFHLWLHRIKEQADRHTTSALPADLLSGTALAEGLEWAGQRSLPTEVSTFLSTSEKQQHSAARRARRLNTGLASLLCLALIATGVAAWQWQTAVQAQHQQLQTHSRQLAAQSDALLDREPDTASLLAVHAYRTSPTDEAHTSLRRAAGLRLNHRLTGHEDSVYTMVSSPDGQWLASASFDGTVRVWDADAGTEIRTLTGDGDALYSVAFSPDGQWLAGAGGEGAVWLWDADTGEEVRTFPSNGGAMDMVAFSPDGQWSASAGDDGTAWVWDADTGEVAHTLPGNKNWVYSVAFSPNGQWLASTGEDGAVWVWDADTGEKVHTLPGNNDVYGVAFSPDGQWLAGAGADGGVWVWEAGTGEVVHALPGYSNSMEGVDDQVVFSPDGQLLASAGEDGAVRVWDANTGKEVHILRGHEDMAEEVVFSPDGQWLVSASYDGTVRVWDANTGDELYVLTSLGDYVHSLVFGPDGQWLAGAAGVADNTSVLVWDTEFLNADENIAQICEALREYQTSDEQSPYLQGLPSDSGCPQ